MRWQAPTFELTIIPKHHSGPQPPVTGGTTITPLAIQNPIPLGAPTGRGFVFPPDHQLSLLAKMLFIPINNLSTSTGKLISTWQNHPLQV
jgi:hypothetical protein